MGTEAGKYNTCVRKREHSPSLCCLGKSGSSIKVEGGAEVGERGNHEMVSE